jgi:hypothetical protein
MLNDRLAAARLVATQLFDLERAMDAAIAEAAAMVAVLPKAAQTGRIAATVGQDAYRDAAAAVQHLITARASIVALHEELHGIQHDVGLGARAMGDGWKAVPKLSADTAETAGAAHLSVVDKVA